MTIIAISASQSERTSVNGTPMVSFMEIMANEQVLERFILPALQSKQFLECLRDADISPARRMGRVVADIVGFRVQRECDITSSWKTSMFFKGNKLVPY